MVTKIQERVPGADFVCGQGASLRALNALVAEIAGTNIPVLLVGESGTGKEVYARLIHSISGLEETLLKKLRCAAADAGQLLEVARESLCAGSDRGDGAGQTVFLDGIHELDVVCQRILLSLLPDGEPKSASGYPVSRLISSTSRNLEKEIEAGRFRRELYFRINGVILRLPPLRERKEDIPALLNCFLAKHSNELKKRAPDLTSEDRRLLASHDWPGNIRELENVARKIVAVGDPALALADLTATRLTRPMTDGGPHGPSLKVAARVASRRAERELILKALEQTRWNRKQAARELQISYKSLLYKIKQIGVEVSSSEEL
jgi:two-component system response regulator AtoC